MSRSSEVKGKPMVVRSSSSPWKKPLSPISSPRLVEKWEFKHLLSDPAEKSRNENSATELDDKDHQLPVFYEKMQSLVQSMLHSETGVPIRSHRNKLLSAVPSVFTGSDMINWLARRLDCSKPEAMHVALLIYKHGYFYSVDKDELQIKDDSTLFRFQTPHLWPSQNFDDSDYTYSIFLLKQIKRSKNTKGVPLAAYQLSNLRKLQSKFSSQWDEINAKADDEVRILKEQRKIARHLITCQERAFWRLRQPPPGESKVGDCFLTKFGIERSKTEQQITVEDDEEELLVREVELLKQMIDTQSQQKVVTSLEKVSNNCKKYSLFDPMLKTPTNGNPWTTNDDSVWAIEKSLVEFPCERKLKSWSCSLGDMLKDVTGRYNFEAFCKKQYCSENIRFWQAVQDLKMLPLVTVPGSVTLIYDEFIDANAPDMVNLSAEAKAEAQEDLNNPSRYSFSLAQKEIYKLMETDIYPRYLQSDHEKLLKSATNTNSIGRNFLRKFISRSSSTRSSISEIGSPVTEIVSPLHPTRYMKRQLSIGKKPSSTGSVDNIFMAAGKMSSSGNESSRLMTQNFVSPFCGNDYLSPPMTSERRVSAPVIKYSPRTPSPTPSSLSNSLHAASPVKSPSNSVNSFGLTPLNEEKTIEEEFPNDLDDTSSSISGEEKELSDDQDNEDYGNNSVVIRRNSSQKSSSSNLRPARHSVMISRSMEDLSHLAEEDDGMTMAMHQDTFQMGLMSLRTPVDNFNLFDAPRLNKNRYENSYDLQFDPESSMSPTVIATSMKSGVRPSIASLGFNFLTLPSSNHYDHHQIHSSSESIHSTISVC